MRSTTKKFRFTFLSVMVAILISIIVVLSLNSRDVFFPTYEVITENSSLSDLSYKRVTIQGNLLDSKVVDVTTFDGQELFAGIIDEGDLPVIVLYDQSQQNQTEFGGWLIPASDVERSQLIIQELNKSQTDILYEQYGITDLPSEFIERIDNDNQVLVFAETYLIVPEGVDLSLGGLIE